MNRCRAKVRRIVGKWSALSCKRVIGGCVLAFLILQLFSKYFSTRKQDGATSHHVGTSPLIQKLDIKEQTELEDLISRKVHSYSYSVIPYRGNFVNKSSEDFNVNYKADMVALLHIQKTGGSKFNLKLIFNLNISNCYVEPTSTRYICSRSTAGNFEWLLFRLTPQQLIGE